MLLDKKTIFINDLIAQIENDSTLMLIVGISIAIFLVIFLVVVISAMRIKVYKDTYRSIKVKNIDIEEELSRLEKELKVYKITDIKNKKELIEARQIIQRLEHNLKDYPALQISANQTNITLENTQLELEVSYEKYKLLEVQLRDLKQSHNALNEEQIKCRTNNARLLMKIESLKGK